jgi:predicted MPP superfamily phosphohydrolase
MRPALWGSAALGLGALVWGTLIERNAFTLRRVTAAVLEPGEAPLRILHISDLHLAPWQAGKSSWVQSLAELEPDLIVNTGDNLGHTAALPIVRETLRVFEGIPGVFVNGSNDYFGPEFKNPLRYFAGPSQAHDNAVRLDTPLLMSFFEEELNWANLNNSAASLTVGGRRFDFMGVDDPHRHFDSVSKMTRAFDEVEAEQSEANAPAPTLTMGVTHAPYQRILNALINRGSEILFAGHTHGGQVCLPGFGALVTNCDIPRTQVKGLSWWTHNQKTAALHVSAGLGTSIYAPVRFACPPEATLITLTSRV